MTNPPELSGENERDDNPLILIAQGFVLGALSPQLVAERIAADEGLASLPDDALWNVIEQTDREWRDHLERALTQPGNVVIYPFAMATCAQTRTKAIGHFRQGVQGAARVALDARLSLWITRTSGCLLKQGLAMLLVPDFEGAWKIFSDANVFGRMTPDSGQLRLREVMAATYGQWFAARLGRQPQFAEVAEGELGGLRFAPGREAEAERCWNEILEQFAPFEQLLQRKLAAPQQNQKASDDPAMEALIAYVRQLNQHMEAILAGREGLEEARQVLLQSVDVSQLQPGLLGLLSDQHRQLARSAPDRAVILADLNYAMSGLLCGPRALSTKGGCAYALGDALSRRAWPIKDFATLRQAIPFFEEARSIFLSEDGEKESGEVAEITVELANCYRILGDYPKAKKLSHDAIRRLQAFPERRSTLGVTVGSLADLQEKTGDVQGAIASHYKAFQIFVEAKDALHTREALELYTRACLKLGRLDDALAATRQAADLLLEQADIGGAVETLLLLCDQMMRLRRYEEWLQLLQQAEDLLRPHLPQEPEAITDPNWTKRLIQTVPHKFLRLYADLLIWRGTALTFLLKHPSGLYSPELAFSRLESARQISLQLPDHNLVAKAISQMATLFIQAGRFEEAEEFCDMVEHVPCSPAQQQRGNEVRGRILIGQKRYAQAVELWKRTANAFGPDQKVRKFAALWGLGQAFEGLGDLPEAARSFEEALGVFEQSRLDLYESSRMEVMGFAQEIYDHLISLYADSTSPIFRPRDALLWLEKSKSRTFSETMSFSVIPFPDASAEMQAQLQQEQQLLDEVNALRSELFLCCDEQPDRLEAQQKLQDRLEKLNQLWNEMRPLCPEYIELRRGNGMDWDELRECCA